MSPPCDAASLPEAPAKRRSWRWPIGVALTVPILAGLAVLLPWLMNFIVATRGKAELAAVIAEIERSDLRWRWEQLDADRPQVPHEANSARVLREAAAALSGLPPEPCTLPNEDPLLEEYPQNHRLDEGRLACLRAHLGKRERAVALVLSLGRFPRGRVDLDLAPNFFGTQLPDGEAFRAVSALLELELERRLHAGRGAEAAETIRALLHAGAAFRDVPNVILQSQRLTGRIEAVRRIERLLGMGEIPEETCHRLQAHLSAERAEAPLLAGLRGERAGLHSLFVNLEGRVPLADLLVDMLGEAGKENEADVRAAARRYTPRLYADHAACLRIQHLACTITRLPTKDQLAAWNSYQHECGMARVQGADWKGSVVTALVVRGLQRLGEKAVRDQALLSCAVVVLAVERFRLEQQRWPESLDELVPAFLDALPPDPYTGGSLQYTRDDEAVRISCVDRGGNDVAFQVWNTSRRGLAPLPPKPEPQPWMLK